MFTMKQLDECAGLQGELSPLLCHLMGDSQNKKGWMQWFPHGCSDATIVPRQLARVLLQQLTKNKKTWEQSEEHAKSLKEEMKSNFATLSQDAKRRCVAVAVQM